MARFKPLLALVACVLVCFGFTMQADAGPKLPSKGTTTKSKKHAKKRPKPRPKPQPKSTPSWEERWGSESFKVTLLTIRDDGRVESLTGLTGWNPDGVPIGPKRTAELFGCKTRDYLKLSDHPELLYLMENNAWVLLSRAEVTIPRSHVPPGQNTGGTRRKCIDKLILR